MNQGKANVFLRGRDVLVDRNTGGVFRSAWEDDDQSDASFKPPFDPVSVSVTHLPPGLMGLGLERANDLHTYYQIVFRFYADVWFEDTGVGPANRNRLRDARKKIYGSLDVLKSSFHSDWHSEKEIEEAILGRNNL